MAAVAAEYEGRVNIIGVAGRGDLADMQDFVSDGGVGGIVHVNDESGDVWSRFGVVSQPAFAIIDDSGEIDVVVGAQGEAALAGLAESLLAR